MSIKLIDTHSHLHFDHFKEDLPEVIERAKETGVVKIVTIGTDIRSSEESLQIARKYPGFVYAAVGIHPTDCLSTTDSDIEIISQLTREPEVVAIGEIGLDLYWKEVPLGKQWDVFLAMKELAEKRSLPMIIHTRDAYEEMHRFFDQNPPEAALPGVMHSFDGTAEDIDKFTEKGFMISVTGVITFKNYKKHHLIRRIPKDKILIETDSPFLSPHPYRGKRNEPARIKHTFDKLCEIYGLKSSEMADQLYLNTLKLFKFE